MSVRETCADWIRGIEPHDDPALKGNKQITLDPRNLLYFGTGAKQVLPFDINVNFIPQENETRKEALISKFQDET